MGQPYGCWVQDMASLHLFSDAPKRQMWNSPAPSGVCHWGRQVWTGLGTGQCTQQSSWGFVRGLRDYWIRGHTSSE